MWISYLKITNPKIMVVVKARAVNKPNSYETYSNSNLVNVLLGIVLLTFEFELE